MMQLYQEDPNVLELSLEYWAPSQNTHIPLLSLATTKINIKASKMEWVTALVYCD